MHLSNLAHVDPKTASPTRIGFKMLGRRPQGSLREEVR